MFVFSTFDITSPKIDVYFNFMRLHALSNKVFKSRFARVINSLNHLFINHDFIKSLLKRGNLNNNNQMGVQKENINHTSLIRYKDGLY